MGGGFSESEDRTMGTSGLSPALSGGWMRDGECGGGAKIPSDEVSIGEEPPKAGDWRAPWKEGPRVMTVGIPLAGRIVWSASQNSSETMVRAGELPCEAATAPSISRMVLSMTEGGIWEIAASTAAFCSWESEGGTPARRCSASSSHRISGWDEDSQRAMGWEGTVTPNAASLCARSEFRMVWNPGRGNGWGLSAGLVFRQGGMMNDEDDGGESEQ
jgi:hypothetical protein